MRRMKSRIRERGRGERGKEKWERGWRKKRGEKKEITKAALPN